MYREHEKLIPQATGTRFWRNVSLLSANMSIANTYSLQLKAGNGPANVPIFRRDGWPSLAEWGPCTPIGYHGDTDEMLRRQPLHIVHRHRV